LRNPNIGSLPVIQRHADPVQWLQHNLTVGYPENGFLLSICLSGDASEKNDLAAIVDSIALAYRNEVLDQLRQERLVARDLLSRSLDNLNSEIKRKLDEYLDIARESGKVEVSNGSILQSVDQKRLDRVEDELMRLENQLAIDVKDSKDKAKLIEQRVTQLRKSRDELYATIAKHSEISADLETRKRNLDQLHSIAAEMSTRLEWLDLEANAPDQIRQVQPAVVSPQGLTSRLPVARDPVANAR
jgi:myosin heavy subunit